MTVIEETMDLRAPLHTADDQEWRAPIAGAAERWRAPAGWRGEIHAGSKTMETAAIPGLHSTTRARLRARRVVARSGVSRMRPTSVAGWGVLTRLAGDASFRG